MLKKIQGKYQVKALREIGIRKHFLDEVGPSNIERVNRLIALGCIIEFFFSLIAKDYKKSGPRPPINEKLCPSMSIVDC